jgi:single-stranded DNA-binding protein
MVSVCVVCGKVESEPEIRTSKGKVEHAAFNLELSFRGENYGWIRVSCFKNEAEFAARYIHKGANVLATGNLTRGFWKSGEKLVWGEITVTADYLRIFD